MGLFIQATIYLVSFETGPAVVKVFANKIPNS